jgi:hypothetical protein
VTWSAAAETVQAKAHGGTRRGAGAAKRRDARLGRALRAGAGCTSYLGLPRTSRAPASSAGGAELRSRQVRFACWKRLGEPPRHGGLDVPLPRARPPNRLGSPAACSIRGVHRALLRLALARQWPRAGPSARCKRSSDEGSGDAPGSARCSRKCAARSSRASTRARASSSSPRLRASRRARPRRPAARHAPAALDRGHRRPARARRSRHTVSADAEEAQFDDRARARASRRSEPLERRARGRAASAGALPPPRPACDRAASQTLRRRRAWPLRRDRCMVDQHVAHRARGEGARCARAPRSSERRPRRGARRPRAQSAVGWSVWSLRSSAMQAPAMRRQLVVEAFVEARPPRPRRRAATRASSRLVSHPRVVHNESGSLLAPFAGCPARARRSLGR